MKPQVGRVFHPGERRHRLVVGAHVRHRQVVIEHVGPHERGARLRLDREVELWKPGLAAALGRAQVDEKGEEAHSHDRVRIGILVVVHLVKLAGLVAQDLEEFGVLLGDASHVHDAIVHAVDQRVVHARIHLTPRLLRRAHRRDHVAGERAIKVTLSRADKGVDLLLADEPVERDDPWARLLKVRAAVDPRSELGEGGGALNRGSDLAGALECRRLRELVDAVRVPPVARIARTPAVVLHEARVPVALAARCPAFALLVVVPVGAVVGGCDGKKNAGEKSGMMRPRMTAHVSLTAEDGSNQRLTCRKRS